MFQSFHFIFMDEKRGSSWTWINYASILSVPKCQEFAKFVSHEILAEKTSQAHRERFWRLTLEFLKCRKCLRLQSKISSAMKDCDQFTKALEESIELIYPSNLDLLHGLRSKFNVSTHVSFHTSDCSWL